jgi:hypothetical protein
VTGLADDEDAPESSTAGNNNDVVYSRIQQGRSIARWHLDIMNSETIDYETFIHMIHYLGEWKISQASPTNELNWMNQILEMYKSWKNWNDNGVYTPTQIQQNILNDPKIVADLKLRYLYGFEKTIKNLHPDVYNAVLSYKKPNYMPFDYYSDKFWLHWATGGTSGIISGLKGSGKTSFALLLAEIAKRYGKIVLTNIRIVDKDWEDSYFYSFSQLMEKLCDKALHIYEERQKGHDIPGILIIFDEMTVAGVRKKKAMSGKSLNIDEFDRLTRKFYADSLYIWHYEREIPTDIMDSVNFLAHKFGGTTSSGTRRRKTGMFTFIEGNNREIYYIKEIPNTNLKYITEDSAFFKMDIKMSIIVDRLQDIEQEYRDAADEFRMIRDVVRELRKEGGE